MMTANIGEGCSQVQLTVITLSGEAVWPPAPMAADATVAELVRELRRKTGFAEPLRLVLGTRELVAGERLGGLQAADASLEVVLLRDALDKDTLERLRRQSIRIHSCFGGQGRSPAWLTLTEYLSLSANDADMPAVAYLLLESKATIEELDLRGSDLTDIGPLTEALYLNRSLRKLTIQGDRIHDVGDLADAWMANETLREVDLRGCRLPRGVRLQLQAVQREKELTGYCCLRMEPE